MRRLYIFVASLAVVFTLNSYAKEIESKKEALFEIYLGMSEVDTVMGTNGRYSGEFEIQKITDLDYAKGYCALTITAAVKLNSQSLFLSNEKIYKAVFHFDFDKGVGWSKVEKRKKIFDEAGQKLRDAMGLGDFYLYDIKFAVDPKEKADGLELGVFYEDEYYPVEFIYDETPTALFNMTKGMRYLHKHCYNHK